MSQKQDERASYWDGARSAGAVLLCTLLMAAPAGAQELHGSVVGTVRDASGAVLPGVTIEAKSQGGAVATTVTREDGAFRFPSLLPGRYEVTGALQGFNVARVANVDLRLGQVLRIDLAMQISGVAETVEVAAQSPIIDVTQSAASTNIQREFIDAIPKGRNFESIVPLAPGANLESKGGGLSIDGASGSDNRFFIDGVDTTNLKTGVNAKTLLTEFVEEVQVKSSGYPAEFGGATGGVINVITRSGTNVFHGDGGSWFSGDDLRADPRPTLRLVLTGQNASEFVTFPKDENTRWEPFFNVGGPIVRDKVWFFGGYTPQLEETTRTVAFRTNGQTGAFDRRDDSHFVTGNITAQLTQALRVRGSGNIERFEREGVLPAIDGTSSPTANFAIDRKQPNDSFSGSVDYVVNNRLFLNGKANYLQYDTEDFGIPTDRRFIFVESNSGIPGVPADLVRSRNFTNITGNRAVVEDRFRRVGFTSDATLFADLAGQHTLKGGIQYYRVTNDVFDAEQAPNISLRWNQAHTALDGRVVSGALGTYSWRTFGTQGLVNVNNTALFLQDDWSVNNRLTLNLGVRTEYEEIPSFTEGLNGIEFDFADKIAPRVGFAYDVRGDGRWKAYGSWGIFYDQMKLELPRGAFGGDKWIESFYTLDTPDWTQIGANGNFPGTLIEQVNFRIPSNDPSCPECGGIDPDLKPMKSQEAVFGLDHELNASTSVGIRYVHKQLDRTIEDVGIIVPGLGEVFFTANPGEGIAEHIIGPEFPALPEAQRDYDALEVRFTRRFRNHWALNSSYTLSRLYGNYSGLASSDENGRTSPNVNRFFDGINMSFDQNAQPVVGRLATDRPHQFKLNGFYQTPWGTTIGGVYYAASGTPISRQVNVVSSLPVFYLGRESDGRLPVFSQTDLNLTQSVRLPGAQRTRVEVMLNILNLFDQDTATNRFASETRQNIPISDEDFFNGFDVQQLIQQFNITRDPRFLKDSAFQAPRAIRVGAKFSF
ncbi:MAG: TonB-dependent receptor [Acidobacteriota bacterium]|nr:TonB-dependent receptor [Acidobacteriota bacterium]